MIKEGNFGYLRMGVERRVAGEKAEAAASTARTTAKASMVIDVN